VVGYENRMVVVVDFVDLKNFLQEVIGFGNNFYKFDMDPLIRKINLLE
jgi:hypothetical protein